MDILVNGSMIHLRESFMLPGVIDFGATFLWAISGGLLALRRGNDIIGVLVLALVTATGGGLLRDGIFLQDIPLLVRRWQYLAIVLLATLFVSLFRERLKHIEPLVMLVDALGLGAFAVVGTQLALRAGISLAGSALVGVVNSVGGSVLRDVLIREEPALMRPGTYHAALSVIAAPLFLTLVVGFRVPTHLAAWTTIIVTFILRLLTVRFNLRTKPLRQQQYSEER